MIDLTTQRPVYNKSAPCIAKIKERTLLTAPHSHKQTYHISLDIENTQLHFTPGDSIAIFAENDPKYVGQLLQYLSCDPEKTLIDPRSSKSLDAFTYFTSKVNLCKIPASLLRHLATLEIDPDKKRYFSSLTQPENKIAMAEFIEKNDLLELFFNLGPSSICTQSLCEHFSPLLPRFYSISSSLTAHANEVHLLVALASYTYKEETRYGIASHFLCNLATPGLTEVPLYVQPSKHFKLPEDPSANIIMIGPGTGVAPYRAFLQERMAQRASGKNWLFFGGRNHSGDFLYGDLWSQLQTDGILKLSTAFSRDQEQKRYVQHALSENSSEIFDWVEKGAYFYVCGDATNMAKDVESTFIALIQKEGSFTEEDAKTYFKALKTSRRYLTDVY